MAQLSERWLAVLGLGAGATLEDAREAYRDLVKVWHPDRFGTDLRLRAKAEEMTKQITAAYQALLSSAARPGARGRPDGSASAENTGRIRPRQVRLSLPDVAVLFDGRVGRLSNVSLTGAMIRLRYEPPVDSAATLVLEAEGQVLELDTRVVRVSREARPCVPGGASPEWNVSVRFENLSPGIQLAIPRFYNRLAKRDAHARRRAPA